MNATIISNKNIKIWPKDVTINIESPHAIKDSKTCPAVILAQSRTDKVIGRITILTDSIRTIKLKSAKGVPLGTKWAKFLPRLLE